MSNVILIYGPIGSGKTRVCIDLAERLCSVNQSIVGILSKRVYHAGELLGYDCLDLSSDHVFPLARLRNQICGRDWFNFSELKYAFSISGLKRANGILLGLSKKLNTSSIIFIDEIGRLERAGVGMYPGIIRVVASLKNGNTAIFTCRTDLVEAVATLFTGRAQNVSKCELGDFEKLWKMIQKYITIC
jgi:nucleoside-triphosphatase THEP1